MQFAYICPCAAAERLPRLARRKVAMLRTFIVGFLESFKSCLLLLVALPGLIDTLHICTCTFASLKDPAMIDYDVATTVLDTESFPQHTIADLSSGITFIVLFIQEKPLRWKEINTHARTHARTHTHNSHPAKN